MAISDTLPPAFYLRGGKVVVAVNVTQEQVTDPQSGATKMIYKYDESEGKDLVEARKIATKLQAIESNLPSWQQVSDAIDAATTLAQMKVIVKNMARVQYWLAKNKAD